MIVFENINGHVTQTAITRSIILSSGVFVEIIAAHMKSDMFVWWIFCIWLYQVIIIVVLGVDMCWLWNYS